MTPSPALARAFALMLAAVSPLLLGAAPGPALPTGTFALATTGRAITVPNGPSFGYTIAPVPNSSVSAPRPLDANSKAPEFSPELFRRKKTYGGEGFIAGSTLQDQQQRRLAPTAGINLKVPLD